MITICDCYDAPGMVLRFLNYIVIQFSHKICEIGPIITPIVLLTTLRAREVKAQSQQEAELPLEPGSLALESTLVIVLYCLSRLKSQM